MKGNEGKPMDFLQIKYFKTVARLEHMSRAAEELHTSQSSLSKIIQRLEDDLGVDLFDRRGRNITLNEFGKAFLKRVDRIFFEVNEARKELNEMAGKDKETITIAVTNSRILPKLFGDHLATHKDVKIGQIIGSYNEMKEILETGEVDFCICPTSIRGERIEWQTLYKEEIYLIVPKPHPLAAKEYVHITELKNEGFISFRQGHGFREVTDDFCRNAGFTPDISFESDEQITVSQLVNEGLGIAFFPKLTYGEDNLPNTKRLGFDPPLYRDVEIAWRKGTRMSKASKELKDFSIKFFSEIT